MPVHSQEFFSGELTPDSLHRMPPGGMDAIGGLGDWFLSDGELCAVVSGRGHATYLSLQGGSLVDLWHCKLANDQWSVNHTQLNLQKDQIPPTESISAGFNSESAWIETRGTVDGIETVIRYQLTAASPGELEIVTAIERKAEGEKLAMVGFMTLHPRASLIPFSVDSENITKSSGFSIPATDTTSPISILSSVSNTDLQVLLGSRHINPTISYGVHAPRAQRTDGNGRTKVLESFMLGGRDFTMFGFFSQAFPGFWAARPGLLSFGLGQLFDLGIGDQLLIRQTIGVSKRADAAFFTDKRFTGSTVSGSVDSGEAGITVLSAEGSPLTFVRSDAAGSFNFQLPEGIVEYTLSVETPFGSTSHPKTASDNNLPGTLTTGTPARLTLPSGNAMSLVFVSESAKPIIFHSELAPVQVDGERLFTGPESLRLNLSGTAADLQEVQLPPGKYRVLATRGPEYSVSEAFITLKAGEVTPLEIAVPVRVVDTPAMIGVDFHVHSGVSFDSSLSPEQRVIDFIAHGGEVLVPTEHNVSYDLRPTIEAMGLSESIVSFPGVEITGMAQSDVAPSTIGHSNVFPIQVDPDAFMGGTLSFEGKRLGQVIAAYKARYPNSIFQLNHPRTEAFDDDITFFNHLSQGVAFEPKISLEEDDNKLLIEALPGTTFRDIDFDAIELLNGESLDIYKAVRADWFALIKQNFYKVATANSDSHISQQLVAYPRSYVEVANDDPASIDTNDIIAATKRGALYGSTGPILHVRLGTAGPGGTFSGATGTLAISLDQAPWVTANEVRIWLNGELWQTHEISPENPLKIDIEVEQDSFVFVEVSGEASETYSTLLPGFRPFAFANPIFIDVAGDGWQFEELINEIR